MGWLWADLGPSVGPFWHSKDPLGTHCEGLYRFRFRYRSKQVKPRALRDYNRAFWAILGASSPLLASAGCAKRNTAGPRRAAGRPGRVGLKKVLLVGRKAIGRGKVALEGPRASRIFACVRPSSGPSYGPNRPQAGFKMAPGGAKTAPRWPQRAPRRMIGAKMTTKRPHDAPKMPEMAQEGPNMAQEALKGHPKSIKHHRKTNGFCIFSA